MTKEDMQTLRILFGQGLTDNEIAEKMCGLVEKHTGVLATDVVVASTGVIGQPLKLAPIEKAMADLAAGSFEK